MMGDVLDERSHRLRMETYSSVQTVKYHLRSMGKSSVECYSRTDKLHGPIDLQLCRNIQSASREYRDEQAERRKAKAEKSKQKSAAEMSKLSKRKLKDLAQSAAKKARLSHCVKLSKTKKKHSKK